MATGVSYYGRISTNVISHYFKNDVWNDITSFRPFFVALKKKGNIETGLDGQDLVWNVQAGRHALSNYSEGQNITIARKKHEIQCRLPWAFYYIDDAITKDEIALASGESAILKINTQLLKRMREAFETRLGYEILQQNGGTSASNVVHGLPTIFQAYTATGYFTGASVTVSGTYAGQTLNLSGITSIDNPESDAWTPRIYNYATVSGWYNTSGALLTGTDWATKCLTILTTAKDAATLGNKSSDVPDMVLHSRANFSAFKNALTQYQRLMVNGTAPDKVGLGIPGAVEYDGLEHTFDVDVTSTDSFLLNFNHIWMDVLKTVDGSAMPGIPGGGGPGKDDMFEVTTQNDIYSNALVARVNLRWQLRMNPRYQTKITSVT